MDRHFTRTIQDYDFERFGISIHGFYSLNIGGYKNTEGLIRQFNQWEEKKGPIALLGLGRLSFITGEEIDERFWNSNFFKDSSGLDLSYVVALHRLGADIPQRIRQQYDKDIQEHGAVIRKLSEENKANSRRVEEEHSKLASLLLE